MELYNMEHLIDIPGRLNSVAVEKHIAGADQIYDDFLKTTLDILNLENITDVKVQDNKLLFLNIQGLVLKEISITSGTQKQSDWNLTDSTQVDFIKGKPTVYNKLEVDDKLITKQDTIDDLATIRSNAQAGATAYQKPVTGIPATDLASAVQVSLDKADTALQEHQSLAGLVNTGSYNTVSKKIELKHDNTILAEIDATAFIKDGMVSSVTISNGYLVITFNTDAGKEPISIALTDIFNPANYYDKDDVDGLLAGKVDKETGKGLSTNDYTTAEKTKLGALPTNEELTQALGGKANTSDLAEVATSGSYNDLSDKPTIPTVPTNVSAFTNDAGYLTQHQDITGKADKVNNATNGNFAALDSNGNLIDSGHKHSDYLTSHQDLSNYVQKSNTQGLLKNDGTVDTTQYLSQHQDISGKEDIIHIEAVASGTTTITAQVNKYYDVAGEVGALAITLPTPTDLTKVSMVVVHLTAGTTPNVVIGSATTIDYSAAYDISASKEYEINCLFNGGKWVVADMEVV